MKHKEDQEMKNHIMPREEVIQEIILTNDYEVNLKIENKKLTVLMDQDKNNMINVNTIKLDLNDTITKQHISGIKCSEHKKNMKNSPSKELNMSFFSYVRGYENRKPKNE